MNRICLILCIIISTTASAQDTLPNFSVNNAGGNRVIVGWVNTYGLVKQIGIQRSFDSIKNFKTILSVADPNARQNGFADTKAPNDHMYYRLFVVLDKGQFFFTQSKKPVIDTTRTVKDGPVENVKVEEVPVTKPAVQKKPEFVPSFYVYTNKEGYVFINLPDADKKKYRIKFFEMDDSFLFEIKSIKESGLTLDKTNFLHSGWFNFELYDDEKLIEKNKFYLSKDF